MRSTVVVALGGLGAVALATCVPTSEFSYEEGSGDDTVATMSPPDQPNGLTVTRVDLIADQEGEALAQDPDLINAWGLAFAPTGRPWVVSNGRGLSQVYDVENQRRLSVVIPAPDEESTSAPTGTVFNGTTAFNRDIFIFVTEEGTIAGWNGSNPNRAELRVDRSGEGENAPIYKGVTIGRAAGHAFLYAADFHNGRVDVYDENYEPLRTEDAQKRFIDPELPEGFAPFNVFAQGPFVFVTYAKQDEEREDDVKGPGLGYVNVFDASGRKHVRLVSGGDLNAPWGLEIQPAPDDFALDLYVGNFGDGRINVYRLSFEEFELHVSGKGPLLDANERPIAIDGLWGIEFGPGASGFERNELYFAAGPDDETHGLFGKLVFPR
jgi:uncharacterized protein (TIGR03118 family)